MLLTPDQEAIREAMRDFCQAELWPHAARWDREHRFPTEAPSAARPWCWKRSPRATAAPAPPSA
jgi:alkylation response protein AidB-like acyl-CoA dehydrogenase